LSGQQLNIKKYILFVISTTFSFKLAVEYKKTILFVILTTFSFKFILNYDKY